MNKKIMLCAIVLFVIPTAEGMLRLGRGALVRASRVVLPIAQKHGLADTTEARVWCVGDEGLKRMLEGKTCELEPNPKEEHQDHKAVARLRNWIEQLDTEVYALKSRVIDLELAQQNKEDQQST